MIRVELCQPFGDLLDGGIRVAVFIQEVVALDFEPQMVDAVGHSIDKVIAPVPEGRPVILYKMESRFLAVFIVTMQVYPFLLIVCSDVRVYTPNFISGNNSVFH